MIGQFDLFGGPPAGNTTLLIELIRSADAVLIKKLSNNDRDWAQLPNKHQAGVYLPPAQRDSGFFPAMSVKARAIEGAEIRECFFRTEWPQIAESRKTRLVNYTSKGAETHMTGVPKGAFSTLSPASLLVMGRYMIDGTPTYRCLTIDSAAEDALMLADTFGLNADFVIDIFDPSAVLAVERSRILDFAELAVAAWTEGRIVKFASEHAVMPNTIALASMARAKYLTDNGLANLDPFILEAPGDAIRAISRSVEWELFREYQRRERAIELVRTVLGDIPGEITAAAIIRSLVDNIAEIDRMMLSASQQRKSRAGYSFEHQIEAMLVDGRVPFDKQVIMDARKRPDFVLPSERQFRMPKPGSAPGLILSAKTTLRERWKQVQREMQGGDLFLATVDETIAANAIEDMATLGITLVVPEELKTSTDTEYGRHSNVSGFKAFFEDEIARRLVIGWA